MSRTTIAEYLKQTNYKQKSKYDVIRKFYWYGQKRVKEELFYSGYDLSENRANEAINNFITNNPEYKAPIYFRAGKMIIIKRVITLNEFYNCIKKIKINKQDRDAKMFTSKLIASVVIIEK
jgi:hypothetical protein